MRKYQIKTHRQECVPFLPSARARCGGHAGLFEAANRGTLFLDEIGEMPVSLQTRLLRVLEEREVVRVGGIRPIPVDVRIISATHCGLDQRIRESRFRSDLFYRLAVLRLQLPTLRERQDDLLPLAEWCLKQALAAMGARPRPNLHAEVITCADLLKKHSWPGNVREMCNMMERLALFLAAEPLQALTPSFVSKITPEILFTSNFATSNTLTGTTPAVADSLPSLMQRFNNNREAVAGHLGVSRTTLWRRLRATKITT